MTDERAEQTTEPGESLEAHEYKAEVARILHLMVHSVYTEKEIFLRELISNASDACDKLRYAALTAPELLGDEPELAITISIDKAQKSITVSDNGMGMDHDELRDNLGTIARSGTKAFLEQLESAQDGTKLIGQFGVGFYSSFIVAEHVEVLSRQAGSDEVYAWASDGASGFTIAEATDEQAASIGRGTAVRLTLNEQSMNFLEEHEIERVVRAYSDHIIFPVRLGDRQINTASALWDRRKEEIREDEYREFYRSTGGALDEPALTIHYRAEGRNEYAVLLFVPTFRPFDLYQPSRSGHVRLYVKRVFITSDAELLPAYLRFVRGVVDSLDMPLNISREMLQNNPTVQAIRKAVTNRVLNEFKICADKDPDSYISLWETFGPVIKEGLYADPERRDALFNLARFRTTSGDAWRSLKQYVESFRENQTAIYYLTGEDQDLLRQSPQLEGFRARGIEVLLFSDPVDSFWVTNALGFDGKPFKSITQGDADLSNIDMAESGTDVAAPAVDDLAPVIERLKETLGEAVGGVEVSSRLVESPACLVAPTEGPDRALDRILARQDQAARQAPILEINPNHPLLGALGDRMAPARGDEFSDLAWLLLDQARVLEGELPSDPAKFAARLNAWVLKGAGE